LSVKAREVYEGSDGELTKIYYESLCRRGPLGFVAMNLFRAQKCSARAKLYRGRRFKDAAYERKDWSLGLLCDALVKHAEGLDIVWGWGRDESAIGFHWVLYVELPGVGQVSFHARHKKAGPDYVKPWDGCIRSADRIIDFCDAVAEGAGAPPTMEAGYQ
jgi:hypothetical protein